MELAELERYMAHLSEALGHADRHAGLRGYCAGLMSPVARKSVEPMAAALDPEHVRSRHQSLHHFVADSDWSDEALRLRVAQWVVPKMDFSDGGWWVIDDTGFPKAGRHSVGVARQYCGMLGKRDNCQVAVSVSLACAAASLPVAWQLYLPKEWAGDPQRRKKAGVPAQIEFATKPSIALEQIEHLLAQGAPRHTVLADAGYGTDTAFRERLSELGLAYVAGITGSVTVWAPPREPLAPNACSGRGPVGKRLRRGGAGDEQHRPQSVKDLALALSALAWYRVSWREGTNQALHSRFARLRVRAAHRDHLRNELRAPEWLLIEWPEGEAEPTKYWLSTLPEAVPLERMVYEAKMRWRIERDYQDLKQDLGLGHYEGRGWRGLHHHASLSIAAYGFLLGRQLSHPQQAGAQKKTPLRQEPAVPTHYLPRGAPPGAAPRPLVHHQLAAAYRRAATS
ncbi:MAG: IS701 family transposase [Lautropia sp.]